MAEGSVDNAMRILLMLRDDGVVRVVDVSERLGVSVSTAHRLLSALRRHGFVHQERRSHSYRVGPALMEFAARGGRIATVRSAARPVARRLASRTGETVNVLVLEGDRVRFVDGAEGRRVPHAAPQTGHVLPATATAAGRILLAAREDEDVERVLVGRVRRLTPETVQDPVHLREELGMVRSQGYAINLGETLEDLHVIAVGIPGPGAELWGALSISVPASRGGTRRLKGFLPALRESASAIASAAAETM